MYEQTQNQKNALVDLLAYLAYVIARTLYIVKLFGPILAKRGYKALKTLAGDISIAREIYGGNNVRFITLSETPSHINNYHMRYEGTEREAA